MYVCDTDPLLWYEITGTERENVKLNTSMNVIYLSLSIH